MKNKIYTPIGTVDIFGKRMRQHQYLIKIISELYENFGFDPLHTPTIEHADVFKGHHGEGEKLFFKLHDKNKVPLVLRYDLTVPLARVVSMYNEIKLPYRRYQIALSFRDDDVDKGHFREFYQCDADSVGVSGLYADADVIMLAYTGLIRLGFKNFKININHRSIIKGLTQYLYGSSSKYIEVQRMLDNANKIMRDSGSSAVVEHFFKKGFSQEFVTKILDLLKIQEYEDIDIFDKIQITVGLINNSESDYGFKELKEIIDFLPNEVIDKVKIDLSLARGADYYTGFIIEASLDDVDIGSVVGGGRFDNLIKNVGNEKELTAVGLAFGLDRIMVAMEELSLFPDMHPNRIVVCYGNYCDQKNAFLCAQKLRSLGYNVFISNEATCFAGSLLIANRNQCDVVVICEDNNYNCSPVRDISCKMSDEISKYLNK